MAEGMQSMNYELLTELRSWTENHLKHLSKEKNRYNESKQHSQLQLDKLHQRKQNMTTEFESAQADRQDNQFKLTSAKSEVNALKKSVQELRPALADLSQKSQTQAQRLDHIKDVLSNRTSQNTNEIKQMGAEIARFQMLGLSFDKVEDGWLHIRFTQIDPLNPERVFSFQIHINDEEGYSVRNCEPPSATIQNLVADLNTRGDFAAFIIDVRKSFKKTVSDNL